jgi:hypothetical protein
MTRRARVLAARAEGAVRIGQRLDGQCESLGPRVTPSAVSHEFRAKHSASREKTDVAASTITSFAVVTPGGGGGSAAGVCAGAGSPQEVRAAIEESGPP